MPHHTPTILVVEDEVPLQKAAATRLTNHGFTTLTARSVAEAKKHLETTAVNAIWLDHYLVGKEDGLDFARHIRNKRATASTPIFLITNTADPDKIDRYLALGHVYYYMKSNFALETIIAEIDRCLNSTTPFVSPSAHANNTLL